MHRAYFTAKPLALGVFQQNPAFADVQEFRRLGPQCAGYPLVRVGARRTAASLFGEREQSTLSGPLAR